MIRDGQGWMRERYPDILRDGDDEAVVRVVRDLDLAYQLGDLPLDSRAPRREDLRRRRFQKPAQRPVWRRRLSLPGAFALAVFAVIGVALAASGILNLGKPTNTLSPDIYFPLSGFHRIPHAVRAGSRAEVLVISSGTLGDGPYFEVEAGERWPIVKALEQFGEFTGLQPIDRPTWTIKFQGRTIPGAGPSIIDWAHSRYRSRYVTFVHRDLSRYDSARQTFVSFQKLSPTERALYRKYAQKRPAQGGLQVAPSLPLVAVGNYLQTTSQIINSGDFQGSLGPQNQPGSPLAFDVIQTALATDQDPPQTKLVEDVNAEANIITALICHADGAQPSKVCGRAAIKQILRHVR